MMYSAEAPVVPAQSTGTWNMVMVAVAAVCGCIGVTSAVSVMAGPTQLYAPVAVQPAVAGRVVSTPVEVVARAKGVQRAMAGALAAQRAAEAAAAPTPALTSATAPATTPYVAIGGLLAIPAALIAMLLRRSEKRPSLAQQAAGVGAAIALASAGPATAASVQFSNLKDGATVSNPVHLEMAVDGYQVAPASEGLQEKSGHFHVLIDSEDSFPEGVPIQFDDSHKHYGKAQTSADLDLAPGKHKLSLQFANALHESYGPDLAQKVTVNVK